MFIASNRAIQLTADQSFFVPNKEKSVVPPGHTRFPLNYFHLMAGQIGPGLYWPAQVQTNQSLCNLLDAVSQVIGRDLGQYWQMVSEIYQRPSINYRRKGGGGESATLSSDVTLGRKTTLHGRRLRSLKYVLGNLWTVSHLQLRVKTDMIRRGHMYDYYGISELLI